MGLFWHSWKIKSTLYKNRVDAKGSRSNSEFRIKYPRGELGQSAGEAELFMIVEHVSGLLEDVEAEIKSMRNNAVNIEFLKKRTEKLTEDVEKLIRNGSHQ